MLSGLLAVLHALASFIEISEWGKRTLRGPRTQFDETKEFRRTRTAIKRNRRRFSDVAYHYPDYRDGQNLPDVPLLCKRSWIEEPTALWPPNAELHDDQAITQAGLRSASGRRAS